MSLFNLSTSDTRLQKKLDNYQVADNGCWNWGGSKNKKGYGQFTIILQGKESSLKAHRFFYECHKGPIPKGLLVCHSCDNPSCVNPDHLWLGTPKDNTQDMINKGRGADRTGEKNWSSKLTLEKAERIREEYATGNHSQRSLAKKYGVGHSTIGCIVRLTRWVKGVT